MAALEDAAHAATYSLRHATEVRVAAASSSAVIETLAARTRVTVPGAAKARAWDIDVETGALKVRVSAPVAGWLAGVALAFDDELDDDSADDALEFYAKRERREAREAERAAERTREQNAVTRSCSRAWQYSQKTPCRIGSGCGCAMPLDTWTERLSKSDRDRLANVVAAPRVPPRPEGGSLRVTVVVPTTASRATYHGFILDCFQSQTWADLELVVYDDGGEPSPVFRSASLEDPRIKYVHVRTPAGVSLGEKRNAMQRVASGHIVACFDDDNIYAPTYVESMVPHLVASGCPTVSLYSSYLLDADGTLWTTQCALGRGETMVFWRPNYSHPNDTFGDVRIGEEASMNSGKVIHAVRDDHGIFVHVNHASNTGVDPATGMDSTDRIKGRGRKVDLADVPNEQLRDRIVAYGRRVR